MLSIAIFNSRQHIQLETDAQEIILGSSNDATENLISISDESVSEFQCLIERSPENTNEEIKITNLGSSMVLGSHSRMHHLIVVNQPLPVYLCMGETHVQIDSCRTEFRIDESIQYLENIGTSSLKNVNQQKHGDEISPSPETLSSWFEALSQIQRSAAGQCDFFKLASRCVFNPGGLDGCLVLGKQGSEWTVLAQYLPYPETNIGYRQDLVDLAIEQQRTLFHDSSKLNAEDLPLDSHAAVVCPILDQEKQTSAVVYGFRCDSRDNNRIGIRKLEAKFVSVVADSISAGLTRLEQEADRARQRVLIEQAFSPEIARHLEANPKILKGQQREISVLFADMREFCRISDRLGPELTYQLLSDVMDRFSQIIHEHHGVVIDFFGDGISAFWNAPVDQPDHPVLACKTSQALHGAIEDLNQVWSSSVGQRLRIGTGIHCGKALVGNSGSKNRWKYGPQGSTVNVASRLEQATKTLGVNLVVSPVIAEAAKDHFVPVRICKAELKGFAKPTDLFTLVEPLEYAKASNWYDQYADCLAKFEAEKHIDAFELLTELADSEASTSHGMLEFLMRKVTEHIPDHQQQLQEPLASPARKLSIVSI